MTDGARRVGTAESCAFPGPSRATLSSSRSALWRALLLGSAIAIAIALLVTALVTQRIAGPLRRLTSAARRLRAGDLGARAEQADMPGELGELAHAFDGMADALEREADARTRIVADLSHEVRTPMTILRGNLEELIDGIEPPTTERLASLHEEVLRLDGLIEQLDVLGRAGSPVRALDCAPVDLSELTAAALEALGSQFAAKRLAAHAELAPVTVQGDRVKLGQVVSNLLSNALKFTPEGGTIDVTVAAGTADVATPRGRRRRLRRATRGSRAGLRALLARNHRRRRRRPRHRTGGGPGDRPRPRRDGDRRYRASRRGALHRGAAAAGVPSPLSPHPAKRCYRARGRPARAQPITPPVTLAASRPALVAARVARALRAPDWHTKATVLPPCSSPIRSPSWPSGMLRAPLMRPLRSSAGSRTSISVSRPRRRPSATSAGGIERVLENNMEGNNSYSVEAAMRAKWKGSSTGAGVARRPALASAAVASAAS